MAAAAHDRPIHNLRDYQRDVFNRWRASSCARSIVVLPTGTGKTWIAVEAILQAIRTSERVLFVAHRRHIVQQTIDRLVAAGVPRWAIGNEASVNESPVVVGSVQSLHRRRVERPFHLAIFDEAHHAVARTWRKLFVESKATRMLGLTATPARIDGKGLGDLFEEIIEGPSAEWLIEHGYLARARIFTVPLDRADEIVRGVWRRGGDYDRARLGRRLRTTTLLGNPVTEWTAKAKGLPTLVFAVDIRHARSLARTFRRHGVRADVVEGTTPQKERDATLDRVRRGKTKVVVSVEVFGEGLDCDTFRCAILCRPTLSLTLYRQQCGRVLRPGRVRPVILDHVGNCHLNGVPEAPVDWSLERGSLANAAALAIRRCKGCGVVVSKSVDRCPDCGQEIETVRRTVQVKRGRLVPLNGEMVPLHVAATRLGLTYKQAYRRLVLGSDPSRRRYGRQRSVVIDGDSYESLKKASIALGVSVNVLSKRIDRSDPPLGRWAVRIGDQTFPNRRVAAEALGISHRLLDSRLRRVSTKIVDPDDLLSRPPNPRSKRVQIGDHTYPSVTAAARAVGVSTETLRIRLSRGADPTKPMPRKDAVPLAYKGQEWPSIRAFARAHGVDPKTVSWRLSHGCDPATGERLRPSTRR